MFVNLGYYFIINVILTKSEVARAGTEKRKTVLQAGFLPNLFNQENSIKLPEILDVPLDFKSDLSNGVKFFLVTPRTINDYMEVKLNDNQSLQQSNYNAKLRTLFFIHGAWGDYRDYHQFIPLNAVKNLNVNVFNVDWGELSNAKFYHGHIAPHVPGVARVIQRFVEFLIRNGQSPRFVHLAGFSLGAHAAGFAGKFLKKKKKTIGRITGLDPAGPGFFDKQPHERIDAKDAHFVDCIHTNAGFYGIGQSICQADFFPAFGTNYQPGCSLIDFGVCSHARSIEYFAESILPGHEFRATSCKGVKQRRPYNCSAFQGVLMGYPANKSHKGIFFVKVNPKYPFATTKLPEFAECKLCSRVKNLPGGSVLSTLVGMVGRTGRVVADITDAFKEKLCSKLPPPKNNFICGLL